MCTKSTQSLLNVHRAFWLCLKSVFAFCMVEGIMPPANLHGESTPDFIVRMYIECTFEFIEAIKRNYRPSSLPFFERFETRLKTLKKRKRRRTIVPFYSFYELECTFNVHSNYEIRGRFAVQIRGRHNSFHHTKCKNTFKAQPKGSVYIQQALCRFGAHSKCSV